MQLYIGTKGSVSQNLGKPFRCSGEAFLFTNGLWKWWTSSVNREICSIFDLKASILLYLLLAWITPTLRWKDGLDTQETVALGDCAVLGICKERKLPFKSSNLQYSVTVLCCMLAYQQQKTRALSAWCCSLWDPSCLIKLYMMEGNVYKTVSEKKSTPNFQFFFHGCLTDNKGMTLHLKGL